MQRKSARWHTVYSLISSAAEELAIAALLLWILPLFGINLPAWAVALILIGFAAFCYVMYLIGHPTISYREVSGIESMVGCQGTVERNLDPEGFVRVCGELWRATSPESGLKEGDEVIVASVAGLRLTVVRKEDREKEN
jgi:membrane protein implicated in regulation of membrane protease activity